MNKPFCCQLCWRYVEKGKYVTVELRDYDGDLEVVKYCSLACLLSALEFKEEEIQ